MPLGSHFVFSRKNREFFKNIFDGSFKNEQKYIGHNPLASYVMIAMLIVTFIVIVTGVLAYGIQDGKGIASFLNEVILLEFVIL